MNSYEKADASSVEEDTSIDFEFNGDIDENLTIPDGAEVLIISKDQSFLTHGIHKFPAKFFPELPRYLLKRYSNPNDMILDPMCGSGTVILESLLNKRRSIGFDIDPMAQMISKAKTTPISRYSLHKIWNDLRRRIDEFIRTGYSPTIPTFNYRDNWFKPHILNELGVIKDAIELIFAYEKSPAIKTFFLVLFSSIVRDVSNADPHCTRTVIRQDLRKDLPKGVAIEKFKQVVELQLGSMMEFHAKLNEIDWHPPFIVGGSATDICLRSESIDLAITSPPYINAVDYPRTHQLEMYWLGLAPDGPLSKMKRKYIGTETVYSEEYSELRTTPYDGLNEILSNIYETDPRRSYIVYKFFEDMMKQLQETYRVLKTGARYCIAIGNNVIREVRVKSHDILSEIATSDAVGFNLDRCFFSGLIRHFIRIPRKERMMGEWVIILQK